MYSVTVRDHIMIAHSFRGEVFGPAQAVHGATYVVDVTFQRRRLDRDGIIVDIGAAGALVRETLAPLNYRNLDEAPAFAGLNTTTEVLAGVVFDRLKARLAAGALGEGGRAVERLRVTLHESHIAWASFEDDLAKDDLGADGAP